MTSTEQARRIAALAQDKLARDVVILDMRPVCSYTDYFVVCTGEQPAPDEGDLGRGARAAQAGQGLLPRSAAGEAEATWIVADYLDVVLHVFTPEARDFYRLEDLWGDVPAGDARGRHGLNHRRRCIRSAMDFEFAARLSEMTAGP